jgi:hypothetical protein
MAMAASPSTTSRVGVVPGLGASARKSWRVGTATSTRDRRAPREYVDIVRQVLASRP